MIPKIYGRYYASLHRISDNVFHSTQPEKSLADCFVSIFSYKFSAIHNTLANVGSFGIFWSYACFCPGFLTFKHISEDEINKIIT